MVVVEGASVSYGGRRILSGIDLELHAGEIFALLGANGAGKTTLMRALCGRVATDRGRVRVMGGDPCVDASARRSIGLVPQEIALYPKLTVRENLEVFGRLAGMSWPEVKKRIEHVLARVRVADVAERRVEVLSGGYQRRANIGVGLLHRPRLLLLDEPMIGVDVDACRTICDIVRTLGRDGTAVLLVTHDFEQAEALADRVGVLLGGRLAVQGPVREVIEGAFGRDAREIQLTFAEEVPAGGARALARLGLSSDEAKRVWTGRARTPANAIQLQEALQRAGLTPREVRTREPNLDSLFLHLVAGEPGRR